MVFEVVYFKAIYCRFFNWFLFLQKIFTLWYGVTDFLWLGYRHLYISNHEKYVLSKICAV